MNGYLIALFFYFFALSLAQNEGFCEKSDEDENCYSEKSHYIHNIRYIFYDVNPPEGFNLRRDVYQRMAVFARKLSGDNWLLVLPPWPHLYHWISDSLPNQSRLPWSLFFNMTALSSFAPVIEMSDFLQTGQKQIEQVFVLQHYKDMFDSGNFEDRFAIESCSEPLAYTRVGDGFNGYFWGYGNLSARDVQCLSFHGPASQLKKVIQGVNARTIMFDHAEIALHDRFGDKEYWEARKSMRFSDSLIREADKFRREKLNWTLSPADGVSWPNPKRTATGDDYLCVHLRRRDFLYGRKKNVPSIKGAAEQIKRILDDLKLDTVFVATDAPKEEKLELKSYLKNYKLVTYLPSKGIKSKFKDGGVAIIEQIICSHARTFYGTHESTYSFRIQEEREIMGFPPETTFNRMCGDQETKCKPPSRWLIVN